MKALLIEFDVCTGERAGGIDPRDPHLKCYGWQDLESIPAKEIRVIEDDRDTAQYEGIEGVRILKSDEEIEKAITENIHPKYAITDELFFKISIEQKKIDINLFRGQSREEIGEKLYKQGVMGITKTEPLRLKDVYYVAKK